jgi:hypothetical protein
VRLAIDPGKRAVGCALRQEMGERIVRAELVEGADRIFADGPEVWRRTAEAVRAWVIGLGFSVGQIEEVAFERPGAYGEDMPSRTLNLQDLIAVCAWVCALFPGARHRQFFPNEWEGALKRPKDWREPDPVILRIQGRLSPEELSRVILPAPSRAHNVWDSVGISLKAAGRFERTRYYGRGLKHATP